MFEQAFKRIDDILRQDPGCQNELDYVEQTSWLLFLRYLDGLEQERATAMKDKLGGDRVSLLERPLTTTHTTTP